MWVATRDAMRKKHNIRLTSMVRKRLKEIKD